MNGDGHRTITDPAISTRPDLSSNVATMPAAIQVTGLEQEVGVALLELAENSWQLIPQRSEAVEIIDHERARRTVRVQVDLHAFAGEESEQWPPWGPGDPLATPRPPVRRPLVRWRGRILLPLAVLDPDSDELPYVTNEAGEVVATLPDHELRRFLRAGLIAAARTALDRELLEPQLFQYLWRAEPPSPRDIRNYRQGEALVRDHRFRTTLRYASSFRYLVVSANPNRGPRRIFTYEYVQPISPRGADPFPPRGTEKRWRKAWQALWQRFDRAGQASTIIPLGDVTGCQRYELDVGAPFDTRYGDAAVELATHPQTAHTRLPCDCAQRTRLRFSLNNDLAPATGTVTADLLALRTGVVRAAVISAPFTLSILALGTLIAIFATDHRVAGNSPDAGAALLLLFPGVVGGILAGPSRHPVTATMQFPTRLTLWMIGAVSFFPAAVIALGTDGWLSVAVWVASTLLCAGATYLLLRQWRQLKPTPARHPTQTR